MRKHLVHLASATVLLLALGAGEDASAAEFYCSAFGGSLSGAITDKLKVDTDCRVSYADLSGNVEFAGPYHLTVESSTVRGNIECRGLGTLAIIDSKVTGNIEGCRGPDHDKPFDPDKRRRFQASLDGYQEVPAVSTTGEGQFQAEVDRATGELRYRLRYRGLEGGDILFAHIHFGRRGTNGGVIAFLCSNATPPAGVDTPLCPSEGETLEGVLRRFDVVGPDLQGIDPGEAGEALDALRAGAGYVNVHTDGFPNGEIRGQIDYGRGKRKLKDKR